MDEVEVCCLVQLKDWLWFEHKMSRTTLSYSDWFFALETTEPRSRALEGQRHKLGVCMFASTYIQFERERMRPKRR